MFLISASVHERGEAALASKNKNEILKQEREKLDNRVVLLSSVTFLYGLLLLFLQKMAESSMTVNGAIAFIEILRWVSLGGAMLCAAWSAYKEKRSFFVYCGICIYIFLSTTVVLRCGKHGKAFLINYLMLVAVFVMTQIYYVLKAHDYYGKKYIKLAFAAVCVLITVLAAAVCIMQRF